jgi:hypothetical protein
MLYVICRYFWFLFSSVCTGLKIFPVSHKGLTVHLVDLQRNFMLTSFHSPGMQFHKTEQEIVKLVTEVYAKVVFKKWIELSFV